MRFSCRSEGNKKGDEQPRFPICKLLMYFIVFLYFEDYTFKAKHYYKARVTWIRVRAIKNIKYKSFFIHLFKAKSY